MEKVFLYTIKLVPKVVFIDYNDFTYTTIAVCIYIF